MRVITTRNIIKMAKKSKFKVTPKAYMMSRQMGKSYSSMLKVAEWLNKGETIFVSTINKGWFEARFKDLGIGEIELISANMEFTNIKNETMYKVIKKS